jgi:succinate dehydrogenase/fumarate reductase flavoprotein subunit
MTYMSGKNPRRRNSDSIMSKKEGVYMSEKKTKKGLSRRDFIKGTAVGAGAVALSGLGKREAKAAPPTAVPKKWDAEADVIVVGYGGAGASTAISAHDAGAKVVLLEKAPLGHEGGNTRASGNMWFSPAPVDKAIAYFNAMSGPYGPPPEMVRVWAEEMGKINDWIKSLGGTPGKLNIFTPEFPKLPGNESVRTYGNPAAMSERLWKLLKANVDKRDIEVWYGSPAKDLIQNCQTREILGVLAEKGGKKVYLKAKRGVVLTCGGFENNQEMIRDYLHLPSGAGRGSPYNTGDGIKMAQKVGADLWHMNNMAGPGLDFKAPELPYAMAPPQEIMRKNCIFVGKDGTRFMDENQEQRHGKVYFHGEWGSPRLPMPIHAIFDETARLDGPIYDKWLQMGWFRIVEPYDWSKDNSVEIEKGWITKADTLKELAAKIGKDPAVLEGTVLRYNAHCAAGQDSDFGTRADHLLPIETPPYYAMAETPCFTNTQGGPRRNEKAQIVDPDGDPIPRLYSSGELGSIYGDCYNGGGNNGESMAFGRIAGKNAAAEKPWG